MALNLSRNTRVWLTTNVNATTGAIDDSSLNPYTLTSVTNTAEFQVLDGYSFSQAVNAADITLSEAGATPARGKRSFNTALNPADFSFSTYIRPRKQTTATTVTCIEKYLWNALTSSVSLDASGWAAVTTTTITRGSPTAAVFTGLQIASAASGPSIGAAYNLVNSSSDDWNQPFIITSVAGTGPYTVGGTFVEAPQTSAGTTATTSGTTKIVAGSWAENGTSTTAYSYASFAGSNKNQLQKFALIFQVDNQFYGIDNCAMNQATIDFGLDAIATIAWTGNGTVVKALTNLTLSTQLSSADTYSTNAGYITNKLSTVSLASSIGGGTSSTAYSVPITGGSITLNNNNNYITPANLGVVNKPIGYYTGNRAISGSVTAYLRTGTTTETGALLSALLNSGSETKYRLQVEIGGVSNGQRVELEMNGTTLQVPSIDVADVVATTINFSAQGYDPVVANQNYDITATNDLQLRYYSTVTG